jgi:hypothetical protein
MAWQLGEFARKRVERGRRLLAESEEHRGSPDLRVGRVGRAGRHLRQRQAPPPAAASSAKQ